MVDIKSLREKFMKKTEEKTKQFLKRDDMFLAEMYRVVEELEKTSNMLRERLEDWYALYFPELKINDAEKFAKVVLAINDKKDVNVELLEKIVGSSKAQRIVELTKSSKGADLSVEQLDKIKRLAELLLRSIELKLFYENEVESLAAKVAPNATHLIGGKLVAKYISLAKGLDKLAKMPASTIQVLGAEKSLFKHLVSKGKVPSPKHGIILLSKYVSLLPKTVRGRMARTLAGKLAIAFKADATDKSFIAKDLKSAVEKRFNELKSSPKAKQKPPSRQRQRGKGKGNRSKRFKGRR